MDCFCGLFLWTVSMDCFYELSINCFYGLFLWTVSVDCFYGLFL